MRIYKLSYILNQSFFKPFAEVAELVDALGSGSSVCMDMGVRVSPSAPKNKHWERNFNIALLFLKGVSPKRIGHSL